MNSPLLALDIGLKRTGVALSESGLIAQPHSVIEAKPPHMTNVVQEVAQLVQEYDIATLVIGLPFTQDETPTGQSLKVEHIIEQIGDELVRRKLTTEIVTVNEFYSSQDARELYPHVDKDSAAAAIILQSYLDANA